MEKMKSRFILESLFGSTDVPFDEKTNVARFYAKLEFLKPDHDVSSEVGMSIPGPTNRDGGYIRTPRIHWHHSWLFELTRRHS